MKQFSLLLLEKNKITVVTRAGKTTHASIPDEVLHNGEVTDKERFQGIVGKALKNEKHSQLLILLGENFTFEKEVTPSENMFESLEFIEMVPYERLLSKTYHLKKSTIVVATNSDLAEEVMQSLEIEDIPLVGIVPLTILKKAFPDMPKKFDSTYLFKKGDVLCEYSITHIDAAKETGITLTLPDMRNPRFIFLTSLFAVLLGILIIMIVTSHFQPKPVAKQSTQKAAAIQTSISPTATPSATLAPSTENTDQNNQ